MCRKCICCVDSSSPMKPYRDWEERFAPLMAEHMRRKRKGKVGHRWYVDETYLKVKGNGATCIAPLTGTAIWWIRCSVRHGTWMQLSASSAALSQWWSPVRHRSP